MWRGVVAAAAVATLAFATSAAAAPGDPDTSFGSGGVVVVPMFAPCTGTCTLFGAGAFADAVAIQPNGDVVVAGGIEGERSEAGLREAGGAQPRGALVRLGLPGVLDGSFGRGGIFEEPTLHISQVYVTPDGALLAYGRGELPNPPSQRGYGIARYTDAGLPDESFGPEGVHWLGGTERVVGATVDREGRLLLLKEAQGGLEVLRYRPSGEPDVSFGSNGAVLMPLELPRSGSEPEIVAAGDGRVLVAYLRLSRSPTEPERSRELFLARVTSDGEVDRTFGHAGIAATGMTLGEYGREYTAAVRPRGEIVVVAGREGQLDAAELSSAGKRIRRFGHDGVSRLGPSTGVPPAPTHGRAYRLTGVSPAAIAFDPAGNAIATGEWDGNAFLARYTPKGRDCSFGTDGLAAAPEVNEPNDIAVQPDGRILIVGSRRDHRLSFVVARFMGGGASRTCPGEGVGKPAPRSRRKPVAGLGPVSVRVPASRSARGAVTISFAPRSRLPRGGYYYAVAALSESSESSCALSSDMHKTAYGFPRRKHRVSLTLYPAPSPAGHWCEQGFYEGAVYAVPHRLRCTKEYPCYRSKAAQCSSEEAERSPCVFGIVLEPVYAYPGGLPEPIDRSTKIVGRFRLRFAGGG